MSQETRTEQELPQDIAELQALLTQLPESVRERITPTFDRVMEGTRRRRRILGLVQDAPSQLRLDLK